MAAECDETARLVASEREARSSSKLVDPDRLSEAVSRYIDWEALAYWAQPALEHCSQLPAEVVCELERRCPGFLELNARQKDFQSRFTSLAADDALDRRPLFPGRENRRLVRCHSRPGAKSSARDSHDGIRRSLR